MCKYGVLAATLLEAAQHKGACIGAAVASRNPTAMQSAWWLQVHSVQMLQDVQPALPLACCRCLVKEDDREAPSFLFESVVNGTQQVGNL